MNKEITKTQYKKVVSTLKSEIIRLTEAQKIRKPKFKQAQRDGDWSLEATLSPKYPSIELTALHIIYNEFRNRPAHTEDDNNFKLSDYEKFKKLIKKVISETVEEVA